MDAEQLTLDLPDERQRRIGKSADLSSGPNCAGSGLDFIGEGWWTIALKTRSKRGFERQFELCDGCGVRQACLDGALERGDWYGIFGGMLPYERRNYVQLLHEAV